ncbi:MAG: hypothetical protein NUW37_01910, partial [Planctomycetes bacterium]|nr:hypothetical protein [Planctomycetota bacterium]
VEAAVSVDVPSTQSETPAELPEVDLPVVETPAPEAPAELPEVDLPAGDANVSRVTETENIPAPVVEAAVSVDVPSTQSETPAELPEVDLPVVETPAAVAESPVVETPAASETPIVRPPPVVRTRTRAAPEETLDVFIERLRGMVSEGESYYRFEAFEIARTYFSDAVSEIESKSELYDDEADFRKLEKIRTDAEFYLARMRHRDRRN